MRLMDSFFNFIQPEEVSQRMLELRFSVHQTAIIDMLGLNSILLYISPNFNIWSHSITSGQFILIELNNDNCNIK